MKQRRRLDVSAVAGVPVALGFILLGQVLEGGGIRSVLQLTAAAIVFGGTLGAVLVSYSLDEVRRACRAVREVFLEPELRMEDTIATVTRFAVKARKDGIMSLEDELEHLQDPFMRRGLGLAVDGTSPTTLRTMLEGESASRDEIDELPARVHEAAGGYAPTIGILGAVLGLIHVMENLTDPNKLGAGIAVAFVATVYGVGSANLVFLPIAAKLRGRAALQAKRRQLVCEGILAIQEGQNPRLIEHKLRGLLGDDGGQRARRVIGKAA